MSRMPLVEPEALPPYLKAIHDATPEENWLGRNFARVFAPNEALVQAYQGFYQPWHVGGSGVLEPRLKETHPPAHRHAQRLRALQERADGPAGGEGG